MHLASVGDRLGTHFASVRDRLGMHFASVGDHLGMHLASVRVIMECMSLTATWNCTWSERRRIKF